MTRGERLSILYVTHAPPSPPRYGAQARMHALMTALAARHELSAVSLAGEEASAQGSAEAMRTYCREVTLVAADRAEGWRKRLGQLGSLASRRSFERRTHSVPRLIATARAMLRARRFDVVNLESPFFPPEAFRVAPSGAPAPRLVLGEHNVEWEVVRQMSQAGGGLVRRLYNAADWRKLRREEQAAWRAVDAVTVTSALDEARVRAAAPAARTALVPNAVDVERFAPHPGHPRPDGRTLLFFGALSYFPNTDGVLWLLGEVWPRIASARPDARLRIVGPRPPPAVLAHRGPRVEVPGFVDDLPREIAGAAAVVAPLRMGGGTRLKILEAMAMGKAVISTTLGAEGLAVRHGVHLLLADGPAALAEACVRVLADPGLAAGLGTAARALVVERYGWASAAAALEALFLDVSAEPRRPQGVTR